MNLSSSRLPNSFVPPNRYYFAKTQFYWDTYFTVRGLIESGRIDLASGMIDNLLFMQKKSGLIPARNSFTSIGRSQPPYLTSMALAVFSKTGDKRWLSKVMQAAEAEYRNIWNSAQRLDRNTNLNRYYPKYLTSYLAVYESGWDSSIRYASNPKNIIPIDLNCLLYKYETDIRNWNAKNNRFAEAQKWQVRIQKREQLINKWLWDDNKGLFCDYDSKSQVHTSPTLAGFWPLWVGLATKAQAARCRKNLRLFEQKFGLSNTPKIVWKNRQWDYPNGWPPLQLAVIEGLQNYGFKSDAKRLAGKWLRLNTKIFFRDGVLWEKYDVVNGDKGRDGKYPTQAGFSWSSAVFLYLYNHYIK